MYVDYKDCKGFSEVDIENLTWVGLEPTTTEFCSDLPTELSGHEFDVHSVPIV